MGGFPSHRAATCTMSLYIGASCRLIGTREPVDRRVACNDLKLGLVTKVCHLLRISRLGTSKAVAVPSTGF